MGLFSTAIGLVGKTPHSLLIKAATYLVAFAIGLGLGNYYATKRAMDAQRADLLKYASDREAAVGEAYGAAQRAFQDRLKVEREREIEADRASHETFQAGIVAAAKAKANAEQRLSLAFADFRKQGEIVDGLKEVNKLLADQVPTDPGCVLPAGVRRALDAASGAGDSASDGNSEAPSPGVSDGPNPSATVLTCEQLARGYVNLSEHDRMLVAWVLAWQRWAYEALLKD